VLLLTPLFVLFHYTTLFRSFLGFLNILKSLFLLIFLFAISKDEVCLCFIVNLLNSFINFSIIPLISLNSYFYRFSHKKTQLFKTGFKLDYLFFIIDFFLIYTFKA